MGALCCPCWKKSTVHCATQTVDIVPQDNNRKSRVKSSPLQRQVDLEASFANISISTTNPLQLIHGYENEPLVSLKEALAPLDGQIDHLQRYIKQAQAKCYYPPNSKLTLDESAAIHIYTMKWGHGCLFDHLQNAWKSKDPIKLKPWFKYLKLFKSAYDKLPDTKVEIWQGQSFDKEVNLIEILNSQTSPIYTGMGSCSTTQDVVDEYLNDHDQKKKLLMGFTFVDGRSPGLYGIQGSSEVLVWPGMQIGVLYQTPWDYEGSLVFHLTGAPSKYQSYRVSRLFTAY